MQVVFRCFLRFSRFLMFTDDLGVTDVNDRGVLLSAKEKLSSLKIEDEETLPRTENDSLRQSVNQPQNKTRPSDITVGEFDDDAGNDNNNDDEYDDDDDELVQQLEPISDDEESTIDQQIVWDEEFQANYVINLSDSGKYNGSSSQEDLTFTDSDDDDEFGKIMMSIFVWVLQRFPALLHPLVYWNALVLCLAAG